MWVLACTVSATALAASADLQAIQQEKPRGGQEDCFASDLRKQLQEYVDGGTDYGQLVCALLVLVGGLKPDSLRGTVQSDSSGQTITVQRSNCTLTLEERAYPQGKSPSTGFGVRVHIVADESFTDGGLPPGDLSAFWGVQTADGKVRGWGNIYIDPDYNRAGDYKDKGQIACGILVDPGDSGWRLSPMVFRVSGEGKEREVTKRIIRWAPDQREIDAEIPEPLLVALRDAIASLFSKG